MNNNQYHLSNAIYYPQFSTPPLNYQTIDFIYSMNNFNYECAKQTNICPSIAGTQYPQNFQPIPVNNFSQPAGQQTNICPSIAGIQYQHNSQYVPVVNNTNLQSGQQTNICPSIAGIQSKFECFSEIPIETKPIAVADNYLTNRPSTKPNKDVKRIVFKSSSNNILRINKLSSCIIKKKKIVKKIAEKIQIRKIPKLIINDKSLQKYWLNRYTLFSLFDKGIQLDRESWYSVTPELVAAKIANRCSCNRIIDGFCGAGGNTIQFAMTCNKVIAIDIDPKKIEMAKHNAGIYGVTDRIEFIVGDYTKLADTLTADNVFLSPPWGGPEYINAETYDLEKSLLPVSASKLMELTRKISANIALFLPRNSDRQQLYDLDTVGDSIEVKRNFSNDREIAITAYFGDLS